MTGVEIIAAAEAAISLLGGIMRAAEANKELTAAQLAELRTKVKTAAYATDARWDQAVEAARTRLGT